MASHMRWHDGTAKVFLATFTTNLHEQPLVWILYYHYIFPSEGTGQSHEVWNIAMEIFPISCYSPEQVIKNSKNILTRFYWTSRWWATCPCHQSIAEPLDMFKIGNSDGDKVVIVYMMHRLQGPNALSTVGLCQQYLGEIVVLPMGIYCNAQCDWPSSSKSFSDTAEK